MDPTLIAILLKNIVIPEVLALIARRRAGGQPDPTPEEIYAHLAQHVAQVQQAGQAFLDATRPPTP